MHSPSYLKLCGTNGKYLYYTTTPTAHVDQTGIGMRYYDLKTKDSKFISGFINTPAGSYNSYVYMITSDQYEAYEGTLYRFTGNGSSKKKIAANVNTAKIISGRLYYIQSLGKSRFCFKMCGPDGSGTKIMVKSFTADPYSSVHSLLRFNLWGARHDLGGIAGYVTTIVPLSACKVGRRGRGNEFSNTLE